MIKKNVQRAGVVLMRGEFMFKNLAKGCSINMACSLNRSVLPILIAISLFAGCNWKRENLVEASRAGHLSRVRALIVNGTDVNAEDPRYEKTALMEASANGQLDVVKALLAAGAKVNVRGSGEPWTALELASADGHLQVVQALLAAGADVNRGAGLARASADGHLQVVQALLGAGADVNAGSCSIGIRGIGVKGDFIRGELVALNPLAAASYEGHLEVVRALLAAKADVNAKGERGLTALMLSSKRPDVMQALIDAGANVNAKEAVPGIYYLEEQERYSRHNSGPPAGGCSTLAIAAMRDYAGAVRTLLAAKASVDAPCYYGETALMLASREGHLAIVKMLIGAGANINAMNDEGDTVLKSAARYGNLDIVQALLAAKVAVNACSVTDLMEGGSLEMLRALLSAGANINARCDEQTVLAAAAGAGQLDVMRALLAVHADVNEARGIALRNAVQMKQVEAVKVLLDAGANPNLRYDRGEPHSTPLSQLDDFPRSEQERQIVELLRHYGAHK